jgi:hypothetical protein
MYSYVSAITLSRSIGSQWVEEDISNILVFNIYDTYQKVYLTLSNTVLPNNIYVDMDSLKAEFSDYNDTLDNLLIFLDNRTLDTVSTLPTLGIKRAKYSDAYLSKYRVDLTTIGHNYPDNYPTEDKHDLLLTRPEYKTNMGLLHDYCLLSVNGYYHMTDKDETNNLAFIAKGADTARKGNQNHVGILSFLDVGRVTKLPIDINKITSDPGGLLKDRTYFAIDQVTDNRSCFLVLGGYLIFPQDNVFWKNGPKNFVLNIQNIEYLEKIYESILTLDLSSLGLTGSPINPDLISIDEIYSDDVIKKYLTLSQSYLVIVDTPNLITNKIHIRHSDLPGMFTSYTDPTYPLIVGHGKSVEYWKVLEDNYWSVTVQDSFYRDYILSITDDSKLISVNNNIVPNIPSRHSRGFLLEIQGYH